MAYTQQTPIGTPDVNLITKTLAGLQPDSALQQYAQLHKNNPYILSLAKSESDRRKSLRTAAQGNPGQMPTVADREIAGMAPAPMMAQQQLPENQGIAQIPTPNIRTMADGGIAGYEDDEEGMATGGMGGMFNFAQQSEPVVRMSGGGAVQKFAGKGESLVRTTDGGKTWTLDIPEMIRDPSVPYYRLIPNPAAKLADMKFSSREAALEAATTASTKYSNAPGAKPYSLPVGAALPTVSNTFDEKDDTQAIRLANKPVSEFAADRKRFGKTEQSGTRQGPNDPIVPRFQPGVSDAPVPAAATSNAAVPPAAAPLDAGGVKDLLPAIPKFNTDYKPATAPTAADAKAKAGELYDSKGQIRSLEGKQAQARQDIFNQRDERLAQLNAFSKEQGPAYAGYEKLLQKEELQDSTDKEKAGLMSLMKGFLAMAAGESPNAATNIAKGAMAGLGDYGDALKEFKKAAKERTKAMADIEQARRSEAKGDFKDQQMYTDRANERLADSTDRFTGLISQITGKEADVAASLLNNMTNITEETNRMMFKEAQVNKRFMAEQIASNARAQMPTGDARTAMMLGSGKTDAERLKSGMGVLQELSADKTGMTAFKILGEINAKNANDPNFKPLTLADLTAFQRDFQRNMQAGPKNVSDKPTGKAFD